MSAVCSPSSSWHNLPAEIRILILCHLLETIIPARMSVAPWPDSRLPYYVFRDAIGDLINVGCNFAVNDLAPAIQHAERVLADECIQPLAAAGKALQKRGEELHGFDYSIKQDPDKAFLRGRLQHMGLILNELRDLRRHCRACATVLSEATTRLKETGNGSND